MRNRLLEGGSVKPFFDVSGQAIELRTAAFCHLLLGIEEPHPQARRPGISCLRRVQLSTGQAVVAGDESRAEQTSTRDQDGALEHWGSAGQRWAPQRTPSEDSEETNVHPHHRSSTQVKPGSAEAYLAANRPFLEATRQEPGNKRHEQFPSVDDPDTILTPEVFDDAAAGEAHVNSDHFQQFVADNQTEQFVAEVPDIIYVDVADRDGWDKMAEF